MIEFGQIAAYVAVVALLFVVPGLAVLLTLKRSISGGTTVASFLKRHGAIGRWQGKVVGSIYIGLGVKLALQERR